MRKFPFVEGVSWFSPSSMSDSSNHVTLLQISMFIYLFIYIWLYMQFLQPMMTPLRVSSRPPVTSNRLLGKSPRLHDASPWPAWTSSRPGRNSRPPGQFNNVLLGCHKSGCHTMYHCTIQLNHGTIVDDRDGRSVHSECTISIHITIMSFW